MLIGFIKHNRAASIVILPIAMLLMWIYGFFNRVVPLTDHAAPLYKLVVGGISDYPMLITLISFALIFCQAILINYLVEKNEIIDTTTYMPALAYIILMSLQPEMFSLHPIVIANLFMLLVVHKLMQTYRKETAYSDAFSTGFFISIAMLFYVPSVVFILLLWIGFILIRPFIWREWVISAIGLILPWIYLLFIYFWNGKLGMLEYDAIYYTIITPRKFIDVFSFAIAEYFQIVVLLIASVFASGKLLSSYGKGTVRARNNLLLLVWFFVLAFASVFLAPEYSIPHLSFLSIPFAIFLSSYLLFAKRTWLAETILLFLIASVFANQLLRIL